MQPVTPRPEIWPINDFEKNLPHHEMLWVEGGFFWMGSGENNAPSNQKPLHSVNVLSFSIARFPVTQDLYCAVIGNGNPSKFLGNSSPVERVSWGDAQNFIQILNEKTGRTLQRWQYALPSEAQWEYAARGGIYKSGMRYAGSNKLKEVGWFSLNSHATTKAIGLKLPNALGLYDMSGNVWEWCEDHYHNSFKKAPVDGSAWVGSKDQNLFRVIRGGCWDRRAWGCNVAFRFRWENTIRNHNIGFRLCLVSK